MKVLFVGGTGVISTACVERAKALGHEVTVLNRGSRMLPEGVDSLVVDVNDFAAARSALSGKEWDAVVDFTLFTPQEAKGRIELFAGKVDHFIFISTASAYQKPVQNFQITERTPLENPYWDYSRQKIECERIFFDASRAGKLPVTAVRPSLTYGATHVPLVLNSWSMPYTIIDRMRKGTALIVPGDGTSLWSITHSEDFAKGLLGLMGQHAAVGEAFHITTDEVMTWDQFYKITAEAAGAPEPKLVHIASDFIISCLPDREGSLLGDKAVSVVFDNSKIKRFVPGFAATIPFADGVTRSIRNMDADESLRSIDHAANQTYDKLLTAYLAGLENAKNAFSQS